jgi:chemotaxis protein CheZ
MKRLIPALSPDGAEPPIAALRIADRLADGRRELEAADHETHAAVDRILARAEDLLAGQVETLDEAKALMADCAAAILEACGFQDLVGQRLTKVARMLAHFEDQTDAATQAEHEAGESLHAVQAESADETRRRAHHLNGPGLDGPLVSQAAIDSLFD